MYRFWIFSLFLFPVFSANGQHEESQPSDLEKHQEHDFSHHRVAILLGHTHVRTADEGKGLLIPAWGFDYEYWFNPKWGLGLHTDLELQTFIIQADHAEEDLEREYPLVVSLDLMHNPWKGLVLELGGGYEFDRNRGFWLVQVGVEYEIHLSKGWDVFPTVFYDSRIQAYDTWTIAFGVGKRF